MVMPLMRGNELVEWIQSQMRVKVLLETGHLSDENLLEESEEKGWAYLQ
jgi:hypothetical protein